MGRTGPAAVSTSAAAPPCAGEVVAHAPDGLAVIDADARFLDANPAAVRLCGLRPGAVAGARSPFPPPGDPAVAGRPGELVLEWEPSPGLRRDFAYVVSQVPGEQRWVVSFRDVTLSLLRERRLAAIAKAASSVASKRSLIGTLEVLAQEVARTDALAGVQVLTVNGSGNRLHVMGSAGFGRSDEFFDRLMQCRALGARLRMLDALSTREPVVVPDRYDAVMQDPAWGPLHDFMRHPRWDWFVSVPLLARGEPVGILNAFFAPGRVVGDTELEFLLAMAEQAAMAVDQAALLERERDVARREERQKLARDLHDSVVQQVFSMMMQARSLGVLVARGLPPAPEKVAQVADDLSTSAADVLADLRGMVVELRPAATSAQGLASALRSLVDSTAARTGVDVQLEYADPDDALAAVDADLLEDVYRVVAEALHNSIKHADATRIHTRLVVAPRDGRQHVVAEVTDDGCGFDGRTAAEPGGSASSRSGSSGLGMTVMRERAARWGGGVRVRRRDDGGTSVLLSLPLPTSVPAFDPEPGR
ncbi:Two component signal transduction histidine kinase [Modestobacter italicus]|uniref:Oxygen sensor histidine kinase NreB n=1 Tax=Modestobacter italicus (strain DSM 44449 / CECT 9708 / BC 501) TaxID=2732864 RepID=I4EY14_MODI5|nr:ATP-binding protein [Modestobacter marinus]CCH88277.1 Two component signal transduction histidine kinase [Modestobacter marinus]